MHRLACPAVAALAACALCPLARAEIASFTVIPPIPGNDGSTALGLSANGQYVVGEVHVPNQGYQPFRWNRTVDPDVQPLGASPGHILGRATDISDDGQTLVGNWTIQSVGYEDASRAFRWRQATGYRFMSPAAGYPYAQANAASANGNTVAGSSISSDYTTRPGGRWANGSTTFSAASSGVLYDISSDGSTAAGVSDPSGFGHAVRWTASGLTDLGTLPGKQYSYAYGITRDGSKIVGGSGYFGAPVGSAKAFMWTEPGGMVDLGVLPGASRTTLTRINDAGTMGIGYANFDTDTQSGPNIPVIWRQGAGFMRADQFIAGLGVSSGSMSIYELTGISGDGTVVTGYGHTPIPFGSRADGFVLTVPAPGVLALVGAPLLLATRRHR